MRPSRCAGHQTPAAGLYVHVPFCLSKCPYCDFYSISSTALVSDWIKALEQEALLYRDRFSEFDSIYLGGGTPTVLDEREVSAVMEILSRHFNISRSPEVTIEANPNDLTMAKLNTYKELGINRVSLGVQSFTESDLKLLGRRHTAGEAEASLEMIIKSGYENVGIDLIYGLPGQKEEEWRKTLEIVVAFHPAHVSCYQLTISSGTAFGERKRRGLVHMPGEEEQRRLFLAASHFLEEQSYVHYEISNFARVERSGACARRNTSGPGSIGNLALCRHNMKYWNRTPYLGLGPSAHSFQGNHRWWNHRSVTRYCESIGRREPPIAGSENLSEDQARLERLFLSLRTRFGMAVEELLQYPNAEMRLSDILRRGYVQLVGERVVPTEKGFLVAERLPLLFC